jgi:hypothetical protein
MRRLRARQKAAGDPVRAFLQAIVDDLKTAGADPKAKIDPWRHARAATASMLLEDLDATDRHVEDAGVQVQLNAIALAHGAVTDEDHEDLRLYHDEQFRKWASDPANSGDDALRVVKSGKVVQAEASLAWADAERAAGIGTSPVLAQGLRSAGVLIRARGRREARSAFSRYTGWVYSLSMASLGGDFEPPYGALE